MSKSHEVRGTPHHAGYPHFQSLPYSRFPASTDNGFALHDLPVNDLVVVGLGGFNHIRCFEIDGHDIACVCGRFPCHTDSLIIGVDGACPGNGTSYATNSAGGVYFGDGLQENFSFRVPDGMNRYRHTNQRAEILAAVEALRAATPFAIKGGQWPCDLSKCRTLCRVRHIVIKSDSAYLVNSATSSLQKWKTNGWLTTKKKPVANQDMWVELIREVDELWRYGTAVGFWHVRRENNQEADELANLGLEIDGL